MSFIPRVGKTYTEHDFSGLNTEQILARPLSDPRFSDQEAGTTHVNWRDMYDVRIRNPLMRRDVETAMDAFAATPEGRATLRQAFAMHQHRTHRGDFQRYYTDAGHSSLPPELTAKQPGARIIIDEIPPSPSNAAVIDSETDSHFNAYEGRINLSLSQIYTGSYRGTDNNLHRNNMQHVLYHELAHAKDPLNSHDHFHLIQHMQEMRGPDGQRLGIKVLEVPVVHDANPYLGNNFGVAPRTSSYFTNPSDPEPFVGQAVDVSARELGTELPPAINHNGKTPTQSQITVTP